MDYNAIQSETEYDALREAISAQGSRISAVEDSVKAVGDTFTSLDAHCDSKTHAPINGRRTNSKMKAMADLCHPMTRNSGKYEQGPEIPTVL